MLKKYNRGLNNHQVSGLFLNKDLVSFGNRSFRILWESSDQKRSQFSILIPKKLISSAVRRNKLNRQLLDDIRQVYSCWTLGRRVAILVKRDALKLSASERRKMLMNLFQKLDNS